MKLVTTLLVDLNVYELWKLNPDCVGGNLAVKSDVQSVVLSQQKFLSVSCVDGCVEVYSIPIDRYHHIDNVIAQLSGKWSLLLKSKN